MLPEVGGVEVLAIAALALIIIGPKDLPVVLRKVGKFVGKMRGMAQEFRASFDELARQSELEELRKEVEAMRMAQNYDPTGLVPGAYGAQSGYDASVAQEDYSGVLPGSHAIDPPAAEPAPAAKAARAPRKSTKPATTKAKAKAPAAKTRPAVKATPPEAKAASAKERKPAKPRQRTGTVR